MSVTRFISDQIFRSLLRNCPNFDVLDNMDTGISRRLSGKFLKVVTVIAITFTLAIPEIYRPCLSYRVPVCHIHDLVLEVTYILQTQIPRWRLFCPGFRYANCLSIHPSIHPYSTMVLISITSWSTWNSI